MPTASDLAWLECFKKVKPKDEVEALSLFFARPVSRVEQAYKRLEPIVVSVVQRYCLPSNSREDLLQAAWLGVARAVSTWRKGRGSALTTWAYIHVRKAVTTARAKEMVLSGCGPAAWKKYGADLYCKEMPTDDVLEDKTQSADQILIERERSQVLQESLRVLNRRHSRVEVQAFVDRLLGKSWAELREEHGRDMRPTVRRMEQEARQLLIERGIVE